MNKTRQIPLDLSYPVSFELTDYIVSDSNADAYHFVDTWLNSEAHFGAIVGPKGSGKSHLLFGWAKEHGAELISPVANIANIQEGRLYIIDDVNHRTRDGGFAYSDEFLFHVYNWTKEKGAKILVSDMQVPSKWLRTLPDLASRMGAVPVAQIEQPDDHLLKFMLGKMFSDRQLQIDFQVIDYLIARMPRSFDAALQLADEIDKTALAERRKITKSLARSCLNAL